jgi:hypothetical protein
MSTITYDFQMATVTAGEHEGKTVAVMSETNGVADCDLGSASVEEGQDPDDLANHKSAQIPVANLRFWVSVQAVYPDGTVMTMDGERVSRKELAARKS